MAKTQAKLDPIDEEFHRWIGGDDEDVAPSGSARGGAVTPSTGPNRQPAVATTGQQEPRALRVAIQSGIAAAFLCAWVYYLLVLL